MTASRTPQEAIAAFYGEEPRSSDWFTVEQSLIDQFGQATCDSDWLHTDPERARREAPFGGTIAFGFWTVSMMTHLARQMMGADYPPGALYGLNYGFDRLRLITPVPIGSRIRGRARLMNVEPRGNERFLLTTDFQIDVEGAEKPALSAHWLTLMVFPPQ